MTGFHISPDEVASLARRCFGEPNKAMSTRCRLRFGRKGSIEVKPELGVFHDFESDKKGGVLAMLVHAGLAATRNEAFAFLARAPARTAHQNLWYDEARRNSTEPDDCERKRSIAVALFGSARPIGRTLAEVYLRIGRAILAPLDGGGVRFHPDVRVRPYARGGATRPAMVARVIDAAGEMIGAHVTYLRSDGLAKADLITPRKMIGNVGGGHVPLIAGSTLIVAEGIESAFSAWDAATSVPGVSMRELGCVAALSAGGVASLRWPTSTAGLLIAPDHDASGAGEAAAQVLASRAWAAGLGVRFIRPPAGFSDWNDAARALGALETPVGLAVAS